MTVEQEVFDILESCISCLQQAAISICGLDFDKHAQETIYAYSLLRRQQLFLMYPIENETVH